MNAEQFRDLMFLWHEYATERDKYLTKDAIYLKQQVLQFVESLPIFREVPNNSIIHNHLNTEICTNNCPWYRANSPVITKVAKANITKQHNDIVWHG